MLFLFTATAHVSAGPRVHVIVGPSAPRLERFAARELAGQFRRLFDADVAISEQVPDDAPHLILLGSPATNPAVKSLLREWPGLSNQGHVLRSARLGDRPVLIVGGGTPVATLWAVYELGHHFGIRYALSGDIFPATNPELKLTDLDLVLEPALKVRTWRTINDFPIGPESWGLAEQVQLLRQLAKLKFNRVMLSFYPWQPFVDFEFHGLRKQTGLLWYGWRYPVDGDTAGRAAFRGAKIFGNPDFAGTSSYAERVTAGTRLARGIIDTAHELGMSAALAFSPLEFPREFAAVLPGAMTVKGLEELTVGPGGAQRVDDSTLMALVKAQIRAYLATYPEIDGLYLSLPEFPEWSEHAEAAWKELDARTGIAQFASLEKLTSSAHDRRLIASGERGVQALRGNVTALEFFQRLLSDKELLRLPGGRSAKITISDVDPAFYPLLDKVLPPGTASLNFIDYTARRVAENRDLLRSVPAAKVPSSLILTLADDNVGVLPQMVHSSLHTLLGELRAGGWEGFSTRYWIAGDLDFSAYYLSRASFAADPGPRQALEAFATPALGEGTAAATWKAFDLIEQATSLIDRNDIGFSFPVPNMLMKHYAARDAIPEWWEKAKGLYAAAMDEMYRVNTRTRDGNRAFSLYLARRCEFAVEYFNCVEAVRNAGLARAKGDKETQLTELEKAIESLHTALNALAAVARNNSDRAVIAVLNEYGYRPLKKELEKE